MKRGLRRKVGLGLREGYRTRICGSAHMLREVKKRKGKGRFYFGFEERVGEEGSELIWEREEFM